MVEDNIEGLPSIVPEELTNEELLEQESIAEEEAGEWKLQEKKKKRNPPPRTFTVKDLRSFCRLQQVH